MRYYKNLGGNSGVHAFEIERKSIKVQFRDGSVYLYNYLLPGVSEVESMKNLAIQGKGLNSYINSYVKKRYASKLL